MGYEIDFLAVGEAKSGDAIALRFGDLNANPPKQTVVVVDGGFADTGKQLVQHLKAYYKTSHVDLVVSTHPDGDHCAGLETVLQECSVDCLWMHRPWNHTDDIAKMFKDGRVTDKGVSESLRKSLDNGRSLERLAERLGIPIVEPFAGISDPTRCVWVAGPSEPYYESLLPGFRCTPEPVQAGLMQKALSGVAESMKRVFENWGFETLDDSGETTAENNSSVILYVAIGDRVILLTADAGIPALTGAADWLETAGVDLSKITFIQVPHHGSRRNVGPTILNRLIGPKLRGEANLKGSFASVATANNPKHPSKAVMNAFRRRGAPVHTTAGAGKCDFWQAPGWAARPGWITSQPVPFYDEVEE